VKSPLLRQEETNAIYGINKEIVLITDEVRFYIAI
jgi:hypothetical protein